MPFIGKNPTAGFASIVKDSFTPNGSATTFTLSKQVANANDIAVFVGNVRQQPTTAYTVNGTTLDFGSGNAPASGLDFYVLHIAGTHESSVVPANGTISTAKLVDNSVTTAKLASTIAPTNLETTASTFKMTDLSSNAFYRTGTFTPFYTTGGTTVAYESDCFSPASYAIQSGNYVRIGDMVHASIFVKIDESAAGFINGGATGEYLAFQGLPFKVKNTTNYYPMTSTVYFNVDTASGWSSYNWVGFGSPDKKDIKLYYSSAGGTVSPVDSISVYRAAGTHDSEVMLQLTYETDEA
jgi:hypothetical protein